MTHIFRPIATATPGDTERKKVIAVYDDVHAMYPALLLSAYLFVASLPLSTHGCISLSLGGEETKYTGTKFTGTGTIPIAAFERNRLAERQFGSLG